jgi:hypothetical protein
MSDGSMFAGDHGPDNAWRSEKGSMLAPHELPYDVQDQNLGDARFNGEITGPKPWEASLVMNGEFDPNKLTRGGGTMAK